MSQPTAKQMTPPIGATISVRFEQLRMLCTVQDVKCSYGQLRLLVSPVSGSGEQWIQLDRVCHMNLATTEPAKMCALTTRAYPTA